jgi:hypothetical protein
MFYLKQTFSQYKTINHWCNTGHGLANINYECRPFSGGKAALVVKQSEVENCEYRRSYAFSTPVLAM